MSGVKDANRDGKIDNNDIDHVDNPWTGEGVNTSDSRPVRVPDSGTGDAFAVQDGVVTFAGLADGTYLVKEIKAPEGFLGGQVNVQFKVTIKGGKAVAFKGIDVWGLAPTNAGDGQTEITDYKVKNVRNISQLPKTGAAGIAMFTVIGLLLAGAAGTVYVKSRKANALLRA
ncbi:LPXTG cell wall anchor domain-containing protein [Bifidobacterium avesanii]|uniref:LPXTG cell wall anchor domain-containing protein n=2 Tax=Bifidobacterium avesanii TaxID=1798157 RepID=A0A7K3TJS2_9BIFI|nr:LPXTG cell wall anchor domain-containing protein [Bifidobacterium avesanii]